MGKEAHCVDECPDELKLTNASVTKGTCKTCAEATKTKNSPGGERLFWDPTISQCVSACE